MNKARDAFLSDIKKEKSYPGLIGGYLAWFRQNDPEAAASLEADIIQTFTSEEGLRVLKLLEKAVLMVALDQDASVGALQQLNANRNLVLEIRRIVANG